MTNTVWATVPVGPRDGLVLPTVAPVAERSTPVDSDFVAFFNAVLPAAVAAARRITGNLPAAEDAAAEALARAYVRWPRLADVSYREAWVMRVAINQALGQARTEARRERILRRQPPPPAAFLDPGSELRQLLVQRIQRLPRRQREVIALRYFADLPVDEIAASLGLSAGTVKTHLHRAIEALRADLGDGVLEEVGP
jgi:RNA polymerase sigma-70 factor (sigma-E family)